MRESVKIISCRCLLPDSRAGPLPYSLCLAVRMTGQRPGGRQKDLERGGRAGTHLSRLLRELTILARKGQRPPSGYFASLCWGKFKSRKRADPRGRHAPARGAGRGTLGSRRGGVTRGDAEVSRARPGGSGTVGQAARLAASKNVGLRRARGLSPFVGARAAALRSGAGPPSLGPWEPVASPHRRALVPPPAALSRASGRPSCGCWACGAGKRPLPGPRRNFSVSRKPPSTTCAPSPLPVTRSSPGVCPFSDLGLVPKGGGAKLV